MPPRKTDRQLEELRQRAEQQAGRPPRSKDLNDALRLAHELQVHQVELELQNEELRNTHEALAQAHELYYKLFNYAPVGFMRLDMHHIIQEANQAAVEIMGNHKARLEGVSLLAKIDMESLEVFQRHFVRASTTPDGSIDEITMAGDRRTVEMRTVGLGKMEQGPGFLTALVDITDRKRFEGELRRSQRELLQERTRLQSIVDQMPAGLLLAEAPSGRIVMENIQAARLRKTDKVLASVENYDAIVLTKTKDGEPLTLKDYPLARAVRQGEVINQELIYYQHGGGIASALSVNAAPIRDAQGEIVAAVCTFQDVTDEERNKQALAELNQELELRVAQRTAELEAKSVSLQEANTALKVLLDNRDQERRSLEESVLANLNLLVVPLLERLRISVTPEVRRSLIQALENHLSEMTSGFTPALNSTQYQLSHRELQVAGLIKTGKTSDEIADILGISPSSVLFHRNNIRKKLGIKGKKQRLSNYLRIIA